MEPSLSLSSSSVKRSFPVPESGADLAPEDVRAGLLALLEWHLLALLPGHELALPLGRVRAHLAGDLGAHLFLHLLRHRLALLAGNFTTLLFRNLGRALHYFIHAS